MKANQLRIGNLVWSNYGRYDRLEDYVVLLHEDFLLTKGHGKSNIAFHFIEPIPLTEEWLLKFGFKESLFLKGLFEIDCGEYEMTVVINSFSGSLKTNPSWFVSILTGYSSQPLVLVKNHIHEIQNLYFAWTGEELTIKEQ